LLFKEKGAAVMSHERWLGTIDQEILTLDRMLRCANHLPADIPYHFANALRSVREEQIKHRLIGCERHPSKARAQARRSNGPIDNPPQNGA
jgi:hypothetical protein